MNTSEQAFPILHEYLIEVDSTPDLSKYKPIVILRQDAFAKLLTLLEAMKEPWIAMKFNDTIFVVWKELAFLYVINNGKEEPLNGTKEGVQS